MYKRILVPIDGSPTADLGCREAIRLAQGLGSELHFLNVVDPRLLFAEVSSTVGPQEILDIWRAGGERLVAQAVAAAAAADVSADAAVRCDPGQRVCDQILEEAKREEADLVVMGTHGRRGVGRLLLGSDAEYVLRLSSIPVLVVRASKPR
jgi:nucleotide-binding universal stress UspA family protein